MQRSPRACWVHAQVSLQHRLGSRRGPRRAKTVSILKVLRASWLCRGLRYLCSCSSASPAHLHGCHSDLCTDGRHDKAPHNGGSKLIDCPLCGKKSVGKINRRVTLSWLLDS